MEGTNSCITVLADGTISGTFEIFGLHTGSEHRIYIDALLTDGKTHFTESHDQVEVTETDNGQGTTTLRIEVNTGKIPDVEPENGSGSSFDVDVNGWESGFTSVTSFCEQPANSNTVSNCVIALVLFIFLFN